MPSSALQKFLIPLQATAARFIERSGWKFGYGGSIGGGQLVGFLYTYSYQTVVTPNGQVGVVETTTPFTGLPVNAVTAPKGTMGGYGGMQLSLSNATIPPDLSGKGVNVGAGGAIGSGGAGLDVALGTGTRGQPINQWTLTLGLGGGEFAAAALPIFSTVTPLCPR